MDGPLAVGGPQSGEALGANVGPAALGSLNSSVVTVAIDFLRLPPPATRRAGPRWKDAQLRQAQALSRCRAHFGFRRRNTKSRRRTPRNRARSPLTAFGDARQSGVRPHFGFHPRAIRCASVIWSGVILAAT